MARTIQTESDIQQEDFPRSIQNADFVVQLILSDWIPSVFRWMSQLARLRR